MDYGKIADLIRKSGDKRFRVTAIIILAGLNILLLRTGNDLKDNMIFLGLSALMFLILSWKYTEAFFCLKNWSFNRMSFVSLYHSFDHNQYFLYVAKKIIPLHIYMIIISAIKCFFLNVNGRRIEMFIALIVISTVCLYGALLFNRSLYLYELKEGRTMIHLFILNFILYDIAMYGYLILIFLFAFFRRFMAAATDVDSMDVIAYYNRMFTPLYIPMTVCIIVLIVSYTGLMLNGYMKKTTVVLSALLIVFTAIKTFTKGNTYILTTENKITVYESESSTEYSFEDIDYYNFYFSQESHDLELAVKTGDGAEILLFGRTGAKSEKYNENFDSIFDFGAFLAGKMTSAGASGEVNDIEELRKIADSSGVKGLDKIIEIAG